MPATTYLKFMRRVYVENLGGFLTVSTKYMYMFRFLFLYG